MGARASAFCKAQPDSNPRTAPVAARLIDLSDRADKLLEQHGSGAAVAATAVVDKATLRRAVSVDLQALMTIARQAAHRFPDISVHRGVPLSRCGEADFIATARVALTSATTLLETLAPFGLSEELLASITQGLDAYKAAVDRKRDALGSRVGAQADLVSVAHEIMGVVASLDAVHAVRFKNSPELMAAWRSARNVPWPGNGTAEEVPPTAPAVSSKAA
jgi:hypothetical protein